MSAALLWVGVPLLGALILITLRRWQSLTAALGSAISLGLAGLAWRVPIDTPVVLGTVTFKLEPVLSLYGRRFVLLNPDRPLLTFLYLGLAAWCLLAIVVQANPQFVPLGLAMVALLIATIAVDPFLYAALIIELAVLTSIPLLLPLGSEPRRGLTRYLAYMTLGVPFILFTGWLLTGVDASPGELTQVVQASVLLGFGFLLLLAIFPFHTWIPMLFNESDPYSAAFVVFVLPVMISLFGVSFLERYAWLRNSQGLYGLLRSAGLLMMLAGGLWAAFQKDFGRMLGFAVIAEIGFTLLALSLPGRGGLEIYFAALVVRAAAVLLWALSLVALRHLSPALSFPALQGIGRQFPLIAAGLLGAHLSLAGFPALAGFPTRLDLWRELADIHALSAWGALIGSLGLLAGAIRSMAVLVMRSPDAEPAEARIPARFSIFTVLGLGILLLLGVLPQVYELWLPGLVRIFPNLAGF